MTTLRTRGESAPPTTRHGAVAAVAGATYVVAEVVGVAVHRSGPPVDAQPSEITEHFQAHAMAAYIQALLVYGLGAFALAVVVWAISERAIYWGQRTIGSLLRATGWAAAAVSLAQMTLRLVQAGAAPHLGYETANHLFDSTNQLNGLKLLLLAVTVACGVALARIRMLPRWLGFEGAVLVPTLVVAGVGCLALSATLGAAAETALVLLIVWVGAVGLATRSVPT
jgi:hypothetical protein